jgi:hypothetical protein
MAQPGEIDIYNGALAAANATLMTTAADAGVTGDTVRALYPARYRSILDLAAWPWATTRAIISREAGSDTEFADRYALPTTLIRMIGVMGNENWLQEGTKLHIDDSDGIVIKFIYEAPIANISGGAQLLLQTGLAIDLATTFLLDENMARRLQETYQLQLRIALSGVQKFIDMPTATFDNPIQHGTR